MATFTTSDRAEIEGRINGTGGYPRLGATEGDTLVIGTTGSLTGSWPTGVLTPNPVNPVTIKGQGKSSTSIIAVLNTISATGFSQLTIEDLTFNVSGLTVAHTTSAILIDNCPFTLNRIAIAGPTTSDHKLFECRAQTRTQQGEANSCDFTGSADDCVSTRATGSFGVGSLFTLNRCTITNCGNQSSDQCLTAHSSFSLTANDCVISTTQGTAVAPDSVTTITINRCHVTSSATVAPTSFSVANRCEFIMAHQVNVGTRASDCLYRLSANLASGIFVAPADGAIVERCIVDGQGFNGDLVRSTSVSFVVRDSILKNTASATYAGVRLNTAGTITVRNCRFVNHYRAVNINGAANAVVHNCISEQANGGGNQFGTVGGTTGTITGDYNTMAGTWGSIYTPSANDINATPSVVNDRPLRGGNCHENGNINAGSLGSFDFFGHERINNSMIDRGPVQSSYSTVEDILIDITEDDGSGGRQLKITPAVNASAADAAELNDVKITTPRADKLDNLDDIISDKATQSSVDALNNLSAAEVNAEVDQALSDAALTGVPNTLSEIQTTLGELENSAGAGADFVTIEIRDSRGLAIADADTWITSDQQGQNLVTGVRQTNSNGKVTYLLDDGADYYLWRQKDGISFSQNPVQFTAVAD